MATTDTNVPQVIVNKLTTAQYNAATKNPNEFYAVTDMPATATIPFGQVDNTSTATAYTATIPGITKLEDGVCMWLKNGVVTCSSDGYTIDVNGLGAKPAYQNMSAAGKDTGVFRTNFTCLFVYDSTRVAGGCWVQDRGYFENTIGYRIRPNQETKTLTDQVGRYRLLFSSADNNQWVPINTSSSSSETAAKTINQRPINPFGTIVYYYSTTLINANITPGAGTVWQQNVLAMGYSYATGSYPNMTAGKPIYIKCAPQADGSAIIDSTTPWVQDLPTTEDGKIYIEIGIAYTARNFELYLSHPIYYYKQGAIRLWTNAV